MASKACDSASSRPPADLVGRVASFLHIDDVSARQHEQGLGPFGTVGSRPGSTRQRCHWATAARAARRDVAALLDAAHGRARPPAGGDAEPPHRAHRTPARAAPARRRRRRRRARRAAARRRPLRPLRHRRRPTPRRPPSRRPRPPRLPPSRPPRRRGRRRRTRRAGVRSACCERRQRRRSREPRGVGAAPSRPWRCPLRRVVVVGGGGARCGRGGPRFLVRPKLNMPGQAESARWARVPEWRP